jgi:hypothetical protein
VASAAHQQPAVTLYWFSFLYLKKKKFMKNIKKFLTTDGLYLNIKK